MSALEFDLCGPLPSGVTVLEASAGTGKTFTIAALATRFVAAGIGLDQLLLVTFTRMATGELRERVRDRLVVTERELSRVLAGANLRGGDEVIELLASGDRDTTRQRRDRLAAAIADFDAATIDTTHSFCQSVLDELGTLGDLEPDVTFVERVDDLIEEAVDDLYVRRFHKHEGRPQLTRAQALEIAKTAIDHPLADVHPFAAPEDSDAAMRRRLALAAREEFDRRKRALALLTYDDLLTRLRATLAGPRGPEAAARLRARYRAVLIDEFQDTDPIQWEIVSRAFGDGSVALVLIGDPKQAIYAFRGADVYAYLEAVTKAGTRRTLQVNRRTDQRLIDGFDALFGRARLGHEDIEYRRVRAAARNREPRLHGAPDPAGLRIRVLDRSQPTLALTASGFVQAASARAQIAEDVAGDVVELLAAGASLEHRHQDGTHAGDEPLAAGHIAVLVQTHRHAGLIQAALEDAGVPAVVGGAGSVFATEAADHWLRLLESLERPASPPRARAAALTPLLGWSASGIAEASEADLEELHRRLYGWAAILRSRGMAALAEAIVTGERLPGRLLRHPGGERLVTDLAHIAELLHGAASSGGLGVAALAAWLRQRIAAAGRERSDDSLARRLESDAQAVQVLTIHRAKGLEFPIVYCPFLWEAARLPRAGVPVFFHDPARGNRRAVDVGGSGREYRDHLNQYGLEERGEDLRLAYVALTRARHQVVVWWAAGWNSGDAPLTRLLLSQDADGNVGARGATPRTDIEVFERFTEVGAKAPGAVSVQWSRRRAAPPFALSRTDRGDLTVARLHRRLDLSWRRTSYSAITAAAHEARVGSEPEERGITDEPEADIEIVAGSAGDSELPLATMALGPRVGTVVHRALEAVDFTERELSAALAGPLAAASERAGVALGCPVPEVAAGLARAIASPLGGALGELTLLSVGRTDRLDELEFELPLAGGDQPAGQLGVDGIAALLREHLDPTDPLAGYAERLADPALAGAMRGYLTGTIDLVLRVGGADGRPRYAVVDYKTNWLAAAGERLSARHYHPAALAAEMQRSHYALQALLYLVALHRYLRWRDSGYEPGSDLLGAHYLFLRGMVGAGASGVFAWRPPAALIAACSDLLDGQEPV